MTSSGAFPGNLRHLILENEPLGPRTWLKIGGPARFFAEPTTEQELVQLVKSANREHVSIRLIGGGSNILVRESGFDGLVIAIPSEGFSAIEVKENKIRCGGGARLSHLITRSVGAGLGGLEHLVGIPGTVGGALRGNASTLNGDIGQRVCGARLLTAQGEIVHRSGNQLHFSTGKSSLDELVILDCEFALEPNDVKILTNRMQTLWIVKRSTQPLPGTSAAIAFLDPVTSSAADLIEQAGYKGASEGGVSLSSQFPNYLIANQHGTSEQVLTLVERTRSTVCKLTGVELQLHLRIW